MPIIIVVMVNVGRSANIHNTIKVHTETYCGAVKNNLKPRQLGVHSRRRTHDQHQINTDNVAR